MNVLATATETVMDLIEQIFTVFTDVLAEIGPAIVNGLTGLLFEVSTTTDSNGVVSTAISGPSVVGIITFSLIGLSLGLSMFYVIFRIARVRV